MMRTQDEKGLHVDPTSAAPTIDSSNLFFFNTNFLDFIKINFSSSFSQHIGFHLLVFFFIYIGFITHPRFIFFISHIMDFLQSFSSPSCSCS
jgi:hypothetical protein